MSYKFEWDSTGIGDLTVERKIYENYHHYALRLLATTLRSWNEVAFTNGADRSPYKQEVERLENMIQWGVDKLNDTTVSIFIEHNISVGTARIIKAALIHAAWFSQRQIEQRTKNTWPSAVLDAMQDKVRRFHQLADQIEYPPADILDELRSEYGMSRPQDVDGISWDAFISHASEDKDGFVRSLAEALKAEGLAIWYDDFTLTVGDSLRRSIDRGLARSKYGVVVLSNKFFAKEWPQKELDGLVAREFDGKKIILPVWHGVTIDQVRKFSPMLGDRLGLSSEEGIPAIARKLFAVIRS